MKTDTYTKIVLTSIAVCLLLIMVQLIGGERVEQVQAASIGKPQWEYKRLSVVQFAWHRNAVGTKYIDTSDDWFEDGVKGSGELIAAKKLNELGEQGWELVSVMPVAALWEEGSVGNQGTPLTSHIILYFRRPR